MLKEGYYLFEENMKLFESDDFIKLARGNNEKSFIRNRKMNAIDVAQYIIDSTKEKNQQLKCIKYNLVRSNTMNISNQGINLHGSSRHLFPYLRSLVTLVPINSNLHSYIIQIMNIVILF